jgi:hypothetical protein
VAVVLRLCLVIDQDHIPISIIQCDNECTQYSRSVYRVHTLVVLSMNCFTTFRPIFAEVVLIPTVL